MSATTLDQPDLSEVRNELVENDGETVTPRLIERMVKCFKGHQCALEFDKRFLNAVIKKDSDAITQSAVTIKSKFSSKINENKIIEIDD